MPGLGVGAGASQDGLWLAVEQCEGWSSERRISQGFRAPLSCLGAVHLSVITEHQLYASLGAEAGWKVKAWVSGVAQEGTSGPIEMAPLVHRWCLLAPAGPRGHLQPGAEDRCEPG